MPDSLLITNIASTAHYQNRGGHLRNGDETAYEHRAKRRTKVHRSHGSEWVSCRTFPVLWRSEIKNWGRYQRTREGGDAGIYIKRKQMGEGISKRNKRLMATRTRKVI